MKIMVLQMLLFLYYVYNIFIKPKNSYEHTEKNLSISLGQLSIT